MTEPTETTKTGEEPKAKTAPMKIAAYAFFFVVLSLAITVLITRPITDRFEDSQERRATENDRLQSLCESFEGAWEAGTFRGEGVCVMPDGTFIDPDVRQKHLDR